MRGYLRYLRSREESGAMYFQVSRTHLSEHLSYGLCEKGVGLSNGEIISSTSQPVFAHNDFSTSSVAHFRFAHV